MTRIRMLLIAGALLLAPAAFGQSNAEVIFPAASRSADSSLVVISGRPKAYSQAYIGVDLSAISAGTPSVRSNVYFFNPSTQTCDTGSLLHFGTPATTVTTIIDGVGFTTVSAVNGVDGVTRAKLPSEFCIRLSTTGGTATSALWIHWVPEP